MLEIELIKTLFFFVFIKFIFTDKKKIKHITVLISPFVSFFLSIYLVYIRTTDLEKNFSNNELDI